MISWSHSYGKLNERRHSRDDPRKDVGVGVVECQLYARYRFQLKLCYLLFSARHAIYVCLSVCLSVTLLNCDHTVLQKVEIGT